MNKHKAVRAAIRWSALVLMLSALLASAQEQVAAPSAKETKEQCDARTRWFREARFGMFIHWGVYAVPAGEWQGQPVRGIGEWIMRRGKIPMVDYKAFAKQFTAAKYDPQAWAHLAKIAGMKYVVITSKHHDGFALYDSAISDWNTVKASAAGRDLIDPLAKAVRAEGLKFGLYYSQAQDWCNPGGATGGNWDPAQDGNYDKYLQTVSLPQVEEIINRYNPAIIWWDTPVQMTEERARPFAELLARHPAILYNNRLGKGYDGDTKTPEQHIPPRGYPGEMFEVCMTMNDTWGFKKNDTNWKSVRQILRNLSDISSKGGNFLLNVGPDSEGVIPAASIERLEAVGKWMNVNGESIYATEASPFPRRLPWGRVTQKRSPDGAATWFLHIWDWPADGRLLLPTVTQTPVAGVVLASGASVQTESSTEGLVVKLPGAATDPDVSIVRLQFARPVQITQEAFNLPDANGRVTLSALDAEAYGNYSGTIQVRNPGPDAYLTDWVNSGWRLEYQFKAPMAQKWTVTAEVATPTPAKLLLTVDKTETPVTVEATGPDLTWKTATLGTIELPAGEPRFGFKAVKEEWKGLSVRNVYLTPAR